MNARAAILSALLPLAACVPWRLAVESVQPGSSIGDIERFGRGLAGINVAASTATFVLAEAAEVTLVSVGSDGRVRPLYPYAEGESSRFTAGLHTIEIPETRVWVAAAAGVGASAAAETDRWRAYNACVAQARNAGRPPQAKADTGRAAAPEPLPRYMVESQCASPPATGAISGGLAGSWETQNDVVVMVVSRLPIGAEELRRRIEGVRVRSERQLRELPIRIAGDRLGPWAGYYSPRIPSPQSQEPPR